MASELASAIQSTHIQHQPSVEHDINPSTAASEKIPAEMVSPSASHDDTTHDDLDDDASEASSALPSDIIRPVPRQPPTRHHLPIPDMRFEQTYLASIKNATSNSQVAYITIRDQILFPFVQGVAYHMLIAGWRYLNRGSKFSGQTLGARVRKWWWRVNNWKIPENETAAQKAAEMDDFYTGKFGSSQGE